MREDHQITRPYGDLVPAAGQPALTGQHMVQRDGVAGGDADTPRHAQLDTPEMPRGDPDVPQHGGEHLGGRTIAPAVATGNG